jgi:hypothetical protein
MKVVVTTINEIQTTNVNLNDSLVIFNRDDRKEPPIKLVFAEDYLEVILNPFKFEAEGYYESK